MAAVRKKRLPRRHGFQNSGPAFLPQCTLVDPFQPSHVANERFTAVDIQVVYDDYPTRFRVSLDCVVNVPREVFFGARSADGRRDHLSQHHVPIADQAQRPMSLVFVFDPLWLAGLHRDRRGDSLERLKARHLVHRYGVCILLEIQVRCLQISLANGLYLLFEDLGIFFLGVEPILATVRLQFGLGQISANLADRDR